METSKNKGFKIINLLRYVVALPVSIIAFYFVGEILLGFANWSYVAGVNKFFVLPIVFIKSVVLASCLYIILPSKKRLGVSLVGIVMIILSSITAYIYIKNGVAVFAGIYIIQTIIWLGTIIFIGVKLSKK